MIVGGQAQVSDSFYWPFVFKLLADGDGDPAFDGGPFADAPWPGALTYSLCDGCSTAVVHDLEVMADGRIVLAGARTDITDVDNPPGTLASASNFFVLRLLPDGTPDEAFGSPDAPVPRLSLVDFDGADGNSHDEAFSLVLDGNGVLLAGHARAADPDPDDDNPDVYDLAVARIGNGDGLFSSGFESPP